MRYNIRRNRKPVEEGVGCFRGFPNDPTDSNQFKTMTMMNMYKGNDHKVYN